jgi:hypothetical protein
VCGDQGSSSASVWVGATGADDEPATEGPKVVVTGRFAGRGSIGRYVRG